ncbi:MAG: ATPase, T2SS/T4P/T4SS family [Syntrophotaleaceae bacterium]
MPFKNLWEKEKPSETTDPQAAANGERVAFFYDIKHKIHNRFVEEANLAALESMDAVEVRDEIIKIIDYFLSEEKALLNQEEKKALTEEILDELTGLGPIEPFFKDPTISDILCNTYKDIYVERRGLLERTNARFIDNAHLMNIIDRIISRVGRRIDESSPMVDARLADGEPC